MIKLWHRKNKVKINNKGMSLVEVLVAMVILSVAGVSFLQSFSYASANNRKAKEKQHALVLAQSMMETIKAYGIEKMDDDAATIFSTYTLGSYGGTTLPSLTDTKHVYKLNEVDFNSAKYNVVIEAEPATEAITKGDVAEIHNPTSKDVEWIQNIEDEQEAVMTAIWEKICDTESSNPDIDDYLNTGYSSAVFFDKELINIEKRVQNIIVNYIDPNYSVRVTTDYTCEVKSFEYIDNNGNVRTFPGLSSFDVTATDVTKEVSDVESLYLYYCPVYDKDPFGNKTSVDVEWLMVEEDWICVHDYKTLGTLDLYLIKQKLPGVDQTTVSTYEDRYSPIIQKYGTGVLNLYHNLNKHAYTQGDIVYSQKTFADGSVDKLALYELKKDNTLMYNVTVDVYRKSDNALVFSLNGTVNEK